MQIQVLGSGASDGWPNPWCDCPSCAAARDQRVVRGQSSVLVDGRLLVDLPPTAALHDLTGVRAVLVTHHHVDHHFAQAWAWHAWAQAGAPLTVLAPPSVLAEARFAPGVTAVPVRPGEMHDVLGYEVRVLAANHVADAVLYDVTGPDGARLLYAADTGPLPQPSVDACADRAFDVALLELTGGTLATHLSLSTWPGQVARLRAVGAVGDGTVLCATHLGHGNPPPDRLDRVLADLGARAVRDGEVLDTRRGRRVLVLGGQSSGKSAYAESRVSGAVTYVATAPPRPGDVDWARRVAVHSARRPAHWATVETGDVAGVLASAGGPVLVDDLGLWLTRVLDGHWDAPGAREVFTEALAALQQAWDTTARPVVLVSPEVGQGVVPATASGRLFADLLGRATTALARTADEVVQVVAGVPRRLR